MKEESRIEALEHELKILKNEIQSTLLEIREQILNHYYPELRAEEPLRAHSLPVRPAPSRPGLPVKSSQRTPELGDTLSEIAAKGQMQPFSDIFLDDLSNDSDLDDNQLVNSRRASAVALDMDDDLDDELEDDDDEMGAGQEVQVHNIAPAHHHLGTTPQTREIDFRQLKQAVAGSDKVKTTLEATPAPSPAKVESPVQRATRPNFAALAAWVGEGVAKVGKERTIQIVETYASGGKLSSETKGSLLQLVELAMDEEPNNPVGSQEMLALMVGLDQIIGQR